MVMKYINWVGLFAVFLLIAACFMPWYHLAWLDFSVTGLHAGANFGKPAYWHFVFSFFYIILHFIPRIWAKQWNVFIAAINVAWMLRNFFALAICSGGECPEREAGIWLLLVASLLMLIAALFPQVSLKKKNTVTNP